MRLRIALGPDLHIHLCERMLRPQVARFDVAYMPIEEARLNEKRIKQTAQFNIQ